MKKSLGYALLVTAAHVLFSVGASAEVNNEDPEKLSLPSTNGIDILIPGDQVDCNQPTVTITVSDFDIGPGALVDPITISFTSDAGDSESLSLAQIISPTTRIWQATLPVSSLGITAMNGTIDCDKGDTLSFFYDDMQNGGVLGIDEFHVVGSVPVELQSFQVE